MYTLGKEPQMPLQRMEELLLNNGRLTTHSPGATAPDNINSTIHLHYSPYNSNTVHDPMRMPLCRGR